MASLKKMRGFLMGFLLIAVTGLLGTLSWLSYDTFNKLSESHQSLKEQASVQASLTRNYYTLYQEGQATLSGVTQQLELTKEQLALSSNEIALDRKLKSLA